MEKNQKKDWVECAFEDLLNYEQPTKYIVESTQYNDKYNTPVLTAGKTFILGYTNETTGVFDNIPTIIFDDFTTATQFVNFKFKVKSSAMKILVPTSKLVNMPFVFYAMQVNYVRNDTHKRYWISVFAKKEFLLPPLPIQRAIVAKIEELFSSLDRGIADLTKAQEQLVVYRQAVLKKAFEGHKEVQFEKIISSTQNGISKRKGEKGDLIKVLRLADIKNLKIDNTNPRKIQLNKDEENKYKLNAGDLIVIRVNGSINLVGRFIHVSKKDEIELWAFCDHFIRITLDLTKCHPIFYYYFFQLSKVRKFINYNMVSSAGQNTVSQTTVKSISVPLISLKEQNQIIREIESRLSVCDKVEESISESLEKAKALRQSILKKAFEGKLLTEEEIEKCKREKDYEPAYKLLERIKAEKKK